MYTATGQFFLLSMLFVVCRGDCPMAGCKPSQSFTADAARFNVSSSSMRLTRAWRVETAATGASVLGCETGGGRVVCTLSNHTLISLSAEGGSPWSVKLTAPLSAPVMDETGGVIAATDGRTLVGYRADGTPRGNPVALYPVNGAVMDLTTTENGVVVLMYRCGFLAAYLTDGVPHASLWLNDTINGTEGTFLPLSTPAVNTDRLYILTAFKPHVSRLANSKVAPSSRHWEAVTKTKTTLLRVYAVDVQRIESERLKISWTYDIVVDGAIPYLDSKTTLCTITVVSSADSREQRPVDEKLQAKQSHAASVASTLVLDETVVSSINYLCSNSSGSCNEEEEADCSLLFSVEDEGATYKENLVTWYRSERVTQLGYYQLTSTALHVMEEKQQQQSELVWVCYKQISSDDECLLLNATSGTAPAMNGLGTPWPWNGNQNRNQEQNQNGKGTHTRDTSMHPQIALATKVMFVHVNDQVYPYTMCGVMAAESTSPRAVSRDYHREASSSVFVAMKCYDETCSTSDFNSWMLPDTEEYVGQMGVLDRKEQNSLVILTATTGVYAYQIQ